MSFLKISTSAEKPEAPVGNNPQAADQNQEAGGNPKVNDIAVRRMSLNENENLNPNLPNPILPERAEQIKPNFDVNYNTHDCWDFNVVKEGPGFVFSLCPDPDGEKGKAFADKGFFDNPNNKFITVMGKAGDFLDKMDKEGKIKIQGFDKNGNRKEVVVNGNQIIFVDEKEFKKLKNQWLSSKAKFEAEQKEKLKEKDSTIKSDTHNTQKKTGTTKTVHNTSRRVSIVAEDATKKDALIKQASMTHAQHIHRMEEQQREDHKKKRDIVNRITEEGEIKGGIEKAILTDESEKQDEKFKSA